MLAFLVGSALQAVVAQAAGQPDQLLTARGETTFCKTVDKDERLSAIVGDIFRNKPIEMHKAGKLPEGFFDSVSAAHFYICDDRLWDAMTLPGAQVRVVFDRSLLMLLYEESEALVIGQRIASDYSEVKDPLAIHGTLMKYVAAQNLDRSLPLLSFQALYDKGAGRPIDLDKYLLSEDVDRQIKNLWLNGLYFLIFHEFCHIHADRLLANGVLAGAGRDANQLEVEADACAINIINRDEGQYSQSPMSFMSVFLVASTQGVLESVLRRSGSVLGHPASGDRLRRAHDLALNFIKSSPLEKQYQAGLDLVLRHFMAVLPK